MPADGNRARVGISYPWVQQGWDFGVPPHDWDGKWANIKGNPVQGQTPPSVRPWDDKVDEYLDCFKCLGVTVIRWVLLGDCLNLGTAQWVRDNEWEVLSTRLPEGFIKDFRALLEKLKARNEKDSTKNLKLLPVVLLPSAFWPGRQVVVWNKAEGPKESAYQKDGKTLLPELRRRNGQRPISWLKHIQDNHRKKVDAAGDFLVVKGGRADLLTGKRRQFFDEVLVPLLAAARDYHDNIYAWEVLTEPELTLAVGPNVQKASNTDGTPRERKNGEQSAGPSTIYYDERDLVFSQEPESFKDYEPKFSQDDVRSFLVEAATKVIAHHFAWTVGFQYHASLADPRWALLDGQNVPEELKLRYLPNFHYYGKPRYSQPAPLPPHTRKPYAEIAIGEFPLAEPSGSSDDPKWKKKDGSDATSLAERLQIIQDAGYAQAIAWSARGGDNRSGWNANIAKAIAFHNGASVCKKCEETFPQQFGIQPPTAIIPPLRLP